MRAALKQFTTKCWWFHHASWLNHYDVCSVLVEHKKHRWDLHSWSMWLFIHSGSWKNSSLIIHCRSIAMHLAHDAADCQIVACHWTYMGGLLSPLASRGLFLLYYYSVKLDTITWRFVQCAMEHAWPDCVVVCRSSEGKLLHLGRHCCCGYSFLCRTYRHRLVFATVRRIFLPVRYRSPNRMSIG
jgi:hypothetical protein